MTKKLIAIFMAILLIVSLCACNDPNTDEETTSGKTINIQTEDTTGTDATEITTETETELPTESETETDDPDEIENPGEYTYTEFDTPETVYVLSATGAATLRAGDYTIITSLANGASLERTGISNGANGFWSQVVYEGQTCYIAIKEFLLFAC